MIIPKNFINYLNIEFIKLIIPILSLPIILPAIGNKHYGEIILCQTICLFLASFCDFGTNIHATRLIVRSEHAPKRQFLIFQKYLSFKFTVAVFVTFLLCLIPFFLDQFNGYLDTFYSSIPLIIAIAATPQFYLQGKERLKWLSNTTLITRIIYILLIFIFINNPEDSFLVAFFNTISILLITIITLYHCYKSNNRWPLFLSLKGNIKVLYKTKNSFIIDFMPNLYNSLATISIGLFINESALGIYAFAKRIYEASESLLYVISRSFYTRVCTSKSFIKPFKKWMVIAIIISSTGPFIFSDLIIEFLADQSFSGSKFIMLTLAPATVLLGIIQYYSQINHASNKFKASSKWTIIASIAGLICLFLLDYIQIYAAVASLIVARFILMFGQIRIRRTT